ncbi:MAG TPA: hypothetical protein PL074_08310, partial [Thermoflexales bacterium]|nr:hypothetical protein [Thermoflexales bacterium]
EGTRLGQGRDNAKTYLREHPEAADKIEKLVRGTIASGTATKAAPVTKPEEGEDDGEAPDEE